MFTREYLLASDWYRQRLAAKQRRDEALWSRHVTYLEQFLARASHRDVAGRMDLAGRLRHAKQQLADARQPRIRRAAPRHDRRRPARPATRSRPSRAARPGRPMTHARRHGMEKPVSAAAEEIPAAWNPQIRQSPKIQPIPSASWPGAPLFELSQGGL